MSDGPIKRKDVKLEQIRSGEVESRKMSLTLSRIGIDTALRSSEVEAQKAKCKEESKSRK
jgi:hypothetical protein